IAIAIAATGCAANDRADDDRADDGRAAQAPAPAGEISPLGDGTTVAHVDPQLGVPTFVWARAASPGLRGPSERRGPIDTARAAIAEQAARYRLDDTDVSAAVVAAVHDRGAGPVLVSFRAEVGGVEVFGEKLSVIMDRDLQPIALSGHLSSSAGLRGPDIAWPGAPADGAAVAVAALAGKAIAGSQVIAAGARNGYEYFGVSPSAGVVLERPVRARKVYFHGPEGLVPAYYVEIEARTGTPVPDLVDLDGRPVPTSEAYSFVIAAGRGDVLLRNNLAAHDGEYTYRVWADPATKLPSDSPAGNGALPKVAPTPDGAQASFIAPSDVTLRNFPFSRNDPWLPAGASETAGNNAEAYLDLLAPDGFGNPTTTQPTDPATADYRAQTTAAGQFLHRQLLDSNVGLAEGRQGSIQQLFYDLNFLHDWFYDAGFDEAAGNAQADNLGRGGIAGDSIEGQVQNFSAFRSATMVTPADGARPRLRMHLFPSPANFLDVLAPTTIAGKRALGVSLVGPQIFDLTANIVQATFSPSPGCAVTNASALVGAIALFDLDDPTGGCDFASRFAGLRNTAALALLVVNSAASPNPLDVTGYTPGVAMPLVSLSSGAASGIKARLAAGATVSARLFRAPDRDGALDAQLVAHEYFHYVSSRLVGNAAGLGQNQAAGLAEGWSDFAALLLTVRPDDTAVSSNTTWNGVYAFATFTTSGVPFSGPANQAYYFGPRRYPYSTDMAKNPLVQQHMANDIPLPSGPPIAFGASGANNAEIHNTGEVWATMLWECYAGLLRDTLGGTPRLTFQQAQDRMKRYLIASLKVLPFFPTITEARDALLAVAVASDVADYVVFRRAFGKRGSGRFANAPSRTSTTNGSASNDFYAGPEIRLVSATLDDSPGSCDQDGVLDHGEYGLLTITLRNIGTTTLTATTVTVLELDMGDSQRWFPNGNVLTLAPTAPNQTTTATLLVALARTVTGTRTATFEVRPRDPQITAIEARHDERVSFRINTDDIPASSARDFVEPTSTPMTTGFAPEFGNVAPWLRIGPSPLFRQWNVSSPNAASDQYLVSPVMTMRFDEFRLAFSSSWAFHSDANGNDDGGVIELSVNGGPFIDFGAAVYNGVIRDYPGDVNPLRGRAGFVGTASPISDLSLSRIVGVGNTVQVRYRAASDIALGGGGWSIDNAAYIGVVETPFATLVEDTDTCTVTPASADLRITVDDGVTSVTRGGSVTYQIVAANDGPDAIIGAQVSDTFPAGLTCTWTCAASPGATCASSGTGDLSDRITLPVGGTATYAASCAVPLTQGGTGISNTATIALPVPVTDPSIANNSATDTDQLLRPAAHLTARKTVTGMFINGGTVRYAIELHNDGPGEQPDLAGDELTDVLPSTLTLVTASATAGTLATDRPANTVTWNGRIATGADVTITIFAVINAPAGTRISNQATFRYDSNGDDTNDATGTSDSPCPTP
ncbi:MAG TPA: M36 family metallopeptidase, partial [Kofleriaceae bacterium]